MSTSERPAPSPKGSGLREKSAAAKPPILAADCSAPGDNSAPIQVQGDLNRQLRDAGIAQADAALDAWTRACWATAIRYWASTGLAFTADHCRDVGVPDPLNPNSVGPQFMAAARAGLIKPVGFAQSRRPSRHAAWMREWIGADAQ